MKKILLVVLTVSLLVTSSFAQVFSDLPDGHWAKGVVEEMVEQKIISGYTDGTFRPSKDITKIESLILLARIAGLNTYTDSATKYLETYTSALAKYTTQYKKDVAYLLGTKVLNTADLDNLLTADKINSPLSREEMAILITKVMGKEEEAKSKSLVVLSFADAKEISANAKPYVYYVYTEKIMTGLDSENFSPKTSVTRAQAAAIFQRIYKKVNIVPDNTGSSTVNPGSSSKPVTSFVTGTITKVDTSAKSVWIKDSLGNTEKYEYDEDTEFLVNSKDSTATALTKNAKITATLTDGAYITVANITKEVEKSTITGTISSFSTSKETITVSKSSKKYTYTYDEDTKFYLDNKTTTAAKALKNSLPVTATVEDDEYATIVKVSSSKSATYGIITDFEIDSDYEGWIEITDADDDDYEYDFYDDCKFYLNGTKKTGSSIKSSLTTAKSKKYEVSLTLNDDEEITKVEITQYPTKGIVSDYDYDDDDDSGIIEIETAFEKTYEYDFDDETVFYLDDKKVSVSKWESTLEDAYDEEYEVELTLDGDYIEKIEIFSEERDSSDSDSTSSSSDTLDDYGYIYGEVYSISTSKIVIVDEDDEKFTFYPSDDCVIIDRDSDDPKGDLEYLEDEDYDLDEDDEVIVFTYKKSSGKYYTSLIIWLN